MIEALREWAVGKQLSAIGWVVGDAAYWLERRPDGPFRKEILNPSDYPSEHPNGAVIIHAGEGERRICAAVLPLEFHDLWPDQIVPVLWP